MQGDEFAAQVRGARRVSADLSLSIDNFLLVHEHLLRPREMYPKDAGEEAA